MAASSGNLAQALTDGGLAPQAAKILANILANAASPQFSAGGDTSDATPTESLRLIDADTRRYLLTNLDYSPQSPFQERIEGNPGQYAGGPSDHPYKDSQPVASAPPLSSPRVQGGDYVKVDNVVDSGSAVSKVDLKLRLEPGRHLRLDPSTKSLEAVALLTRSETPRFLAAEFQEGEGSELVLGLRNLETATLLLANGDSRQVFVFPDAAATGPNNTAAGVNRSLTSVTVTLNTGQTQPLLAWTNGSASAAPSWWTAISSAAGTCRAYAVFDGTTINASNECTPVALSNVLRVVRIDQGLYRVELVTGSVANANYAVVGTASRDDNTATTLHVRNDTSASPVTAPPATTAFYVQVRNAAGNGATNAPRISVCVFQ